jgi:hypothetical protein
MTLTQRSESQNRVLKEGYVNESTSLHMFARRILDSFHHADHIDAGETHYVQVMYHLQLFALAKITTLWLNKLPVRGKRNQTKKCIPYAG